MSITAPLVFQCAKCRQVVGDSWSFVSSNEETKSITLRGASNITKAKKHTTSKADDDLGSTFAQLSCRQCQTNIGRCYLTTPRHLDHQRDLLTFYTDNLCSYQLGQYDIASSVPMTDIEAHAPRSNGGEHGRASPTTMGVDGGDKVADHLGYENLQDILKVSTNHNNANQVF
ncbi:unnamed protein product [Choristocarpus tenellus]